ncbi:MAG: DUF3667 domain-containing protein [Pseudomonadota bacterium]
MICSNCEHELRAEDHYCPNCGQGVVEGRDRSFAYLMRETLAEVSSVDSRLWRSIKGLMLSPGSLSLAFREGRRRQFLTPIGLFLLANLLYFIAPPATDLQLSLYDQYHQQQYRGLITGWVDDYMASSGLSFEAVASAYELRIAEVAKLMVIFHVPFLALVSMLLFTDRKLFYADHFVMALHYFAFIMIYSTTVSAILKTLFWLLPDGTGPYIRKLVPFLLAVILVYLIPMFKRAIGVSWWRAIVMFPLFVAGFLLTHLMFRFVQFVIGFWLISH